MTDRYAIQMSGHGSWVDHVYANGEIVRIDKNAEQYPEIIAEYGSSEALWCGVTSPYKMYVNPTISIYYPGSPPNGIPGSFYGIKIDTVTGQTWIKAQDDNYSGEFVSKSVTYSDTTPVGVDYYAVWTPEEAHTYCEAQGLTYPIPTEFEKEVWIWAVSCNLSDTPEVVKAYRWVE